MPRNKAGRPEWFKFWRRNRKQLDIEVFSVESRGRVFTNIMRYFDDRSSELLPMSPLEQMAFNMIRVNIDEAFEEYEVQADRNRTNGRKGGRPPKSQETE